MKLTKTSLLIAAVVAFTTTGCSFMGQSDSSCPGMAKGYICKGPREVYELTNNKNSLFDGSQEGLEKDEKKKENAGSTPNAAGAKVNYPVTSNLPANSRTMIPADTQTAPEPLALREEARIMRVYFAAYEDSTGSLNLPGYAYVEVEPRTWMVGHAANRNVGRIVPLKVRQDADTNLEKKQKKQDAVDPLGVTHTIPAVGKE